MRRSSQQLLQAIKAAKTKRQKAKACYNLALFHDNNSRESEAIPYYLKAIRIGLNKKLETMARAWLASSLYKTGRAHEAAKQCNRALNAANNPRLLKFLKGLRNRIATRVNRKS
ncbi:MAG TPA: tetratricopeptide repeat protein [Candidatus Sulfotelmatobacter sp.]|nr:tetratricopeptide repeat protein [Candidatus Sulfotelmatobacter sp.]